MMTTLNELNKYVLEMDGTATELNEFHLSALKAAVAIAECKPCTDEMLLELAATRTDDFGALESSIEYRGACLNGDNDEALMLIQEYGFMVNYIKDFKEWSVFNGSKHVYSSNLNLALFSALSNATSEVLNI